MQHSTTLTRNKQAQTIRTANWLAKARAWFTISAIEEDLLAYEDNTTLADGSVYRVPRANLAAAKGLLAAQHAAERRVAAHADRRDQEQPVRM